MPYCERRLSLVQNHCRADGLVPKMSLSTLRENEMNKTTLISNVAIVCTVFSFSASAVDNSMSPENLKKVRAKAIADMKEAISEKHKDPDSAQFRRITTTEVGSFVCGEVNAKNSMGGYVGYKRFYGSTGGGVSPVIEDAPNFYEVMLNHCGKYEEVKPKGVEPKAK